MRILASIKPLNVSLPKPPYEGFFECVTFLWGSSTDSAKVDAPFVAQAPKLLHTLDAVSSDLLDACLAGTKLEFNVLYERSGTSGPFIYLKVNLSQTTVVGAKHRGVAGGSAVPTEELTLSPSGITATFYDDGGKELGHASVNTK